MLEPDVAAGFRALLGPGSEALGGRPVRVFAYLEMEPGPAAFKVTDWRASTGGT